MHSITQYFLGEGTEELFELCLRGRGLPGLLKPTVVQCMGSYTIIPPSIFFCLFFMCLSDLSVGKSMLHTSAHGGQKQVSNSLELELQMVVSCHVGAGN